MCAAGARAVELSPEHRCRGGPAAVELSPERRCHGGARGRLGFVRRRIACAAEGAAAGRAEAGAIPGLSVGFMSRAMRDSCSPASAERYAPCEECYARRARLARLCVAPAGYQMHREMYRGGRCPPSGPFAPAASADTASHAGSRPGRSRKHSAAGGRLTAGGAGPQRTRRPRRTSGGRRSPGRGTRPRDRSRGTRPRPTP
jgi:hypothetical protein